MILVDAIKEIDFLHPEQVVDIQILGGGQHRVKEHHDTGWRSLPNLVLSGILPEEGAGASIVDFSDGTSLNFEPGSVLFIPRNLKHRISNKYRPHTTVWIHWNVTVFQNFDIFFNFPQQVILFQNSEARKLQEILKQLIEQSSFSLYEIVKQRELSYKLLGFLLKHISPAPDFQSFHSKKMAWGQLLKFIDDHLADELALSELAGKWHRSISTLQREFYSDFEMTVGHFIRHRRLQKTIDFLAMRNLTLDEIAEKVGFSNAFSLSRAFKKEFGLSPRAYSQEYFRLKIR